MFARGRQLVSKSTVASARRRHKRALGLLGALFACAVAALLPTIVGLPTATSNGGRKDPGISPERQAAGSGLQRVNNAPGVNNALVELKARDLAASKRSRAKMLQQAIAFVEGSKERLAVNSAEQAFGIIERAAARDDLTALRVLARIIKEGRIRKSEPEKAFGYEVRAADLGDTGSAIAVGFAYARGRGVPQNGDKAIEYLKRGISKEPQAAALKLLGDLHSDRSAASFSLSVSKQYYMDAAAMGDSGAFIELGKRSELARELGWHSSAYRYYQQALSLGNREALRSLGKLYLSTEAPIRDAKSAAHYFFQSAREGDASSIAEIALMQKNGELDNTDRATAITVLEAVVVGDALEKKGRRLLGDLYRQAPGSDSRELAVKNYVRAGELGDGWAMLALGDLERETPDAAQQAYKHYAAAAEAGVARAYVRLGDMTVKGEGVEQDALSFYRRAAQEGDSLGRLRVARTLQSQYKELPALREAMDIYRDSLKSIGYQETVRNMRDGDRNGLVAIVQLLLKEKGFAIDRIDGLLGERTRSQIKKYCRERQLPIEFLSDAFLGEILLTEQQAKAAL